MCSEVTNINRFIKHNLSYLLYQIRVGKATFEYKDEISAPHSLHDFY